MVKKNTFTTSNEVKTHSEAEVCQRLQSRDTFMKEMQRVYSRAKGRKIYGKKEEQTMMGNIPHYLSQWSQGYGMDMYCCPGTSLLLYGADI